jgi:hypothetical protein
MTHITMPTSTVSALSSVVYSPLSVPRRPRTRALTQCLERHPRSTTGIIPEQLAAAAVAAADRTLRRSRRPSHIRLPLCRIITVTTKRRINTRTINQRRLRTHTSTPTTNITATYTFTPNRNPTHMHMHTGPHA